MSNLNFKKFIPIAVVIITIVSVISFSNDLLFENDESVQTLPSIDSDFTELEILETNGVLHLIPLDKIKGGGPPKDGIPSIDHPKFVSAKNSQFMSDSDTVIGLEINGEVKAYPLFILVWHEIVNDVVGGVPVAVTYCPLCYTNQVFERVIDDKVVEFGTSGKLYNSNLLMYDRLSESYWSQALGLAVKGELTGYKLNLIPFDVITWGDWKKLHPDSLVLSTDTGYLRSYATDPYGNYYTEPRIMFPVEHKDSRLNPKIIINDSVGNRNILLISLFSENSRAFDRTLNDNILNFEFINGKIIDTLTNTQWNYDGLAIEGELKGFQLKRLPMYPGFWFEWYAFHPSTLIYGDV